MINGLGSQSCSEPELTSENMNPLRHFDRTLWTGNRLRSNPLSAQNSTTEKDVDTYPCLEWDWKTRTPCLRVQEDAATRAGGIQMLHSGSLYG